MDALMSNDEPKAVPADLRLDDGLGVRWINEQE